MTDKEIMNMEELDNVAGGTGIECIALLSRLKDEGLYNPQTPLTAGNEAAAAKELNSYFAQFSRPEGGGWNVKLSVDAYADGRANSYGITIWRPGYGQWNSISVDELIDKIKSW